jgi:hypothetical protein
MHKVMCHGGFRGSYDDDDSMDDCDKRNSGINSSSISFCRGYFSRELNQNETKRNASAQQAPQSIHDNMGGHFLKLVLVLAVASELSTRAGVADAFSTIPSDSRASFDARNYQEVRRQQQRGQGLFSTPPPLSPLSDNDDYNYDNYTPAEVTKMQDVIVSLSLESNDEIRRSRLTQIMEVGLAGPNGGPKRFTVLFDRVLTQVGEQFQKDALEKYSKQAPSSSAMEPTSDESLDTETDSVPEKDENTKPVEKSPEEIRLWALVDMMIQSKTMIKKHNS